MTILVVGASGATGRLLVQQLLERGESVRVIVRSERAFSKIIGPHKRLSIVEASVLDLSEEQMIEHTTGCHSIASCLGHTLSLKGMFAPPRRLVTDAVTRLCNAVKSAHPERPTKFVLMNTAGNSNRDLNEPLSGAQKVVIGLLRLLLPPHADNEDAADYLRTQIGQNNPTIEWVVVRPDALIDEESVTEVALYPSPIRSAIFNSGKTSRINVGHFMADLLLDANLWQQWAGKMPVIYNRES